MGKGQLSLLHVQVIQPPRNQSESVLANAANRTVCAYPIQVLRGGVCRRLGTYRPPVSASTRSNIEPSFFFVCVLNKQSPMRREIKRERPAVFEAI